MVTTATWASLFIPPLPSCRPFRSAAWRHLARERADRESVRDTGLSPDPRSIVAVATLGQTKAPAEAGAFADYDSRGRVAYVRLLPMFEKMFWSWPRRKIMATITAMAITAIMRAY